MDSSPITALVKSVLPRCFIMYDLAGSHRLEQFTCSLSSMMCLKEDLRSRDERGWGSMLQIFLNRWSSLKINFCNESMSSWSNISWGESSKTAVAWTTMILLLESSLVAVNTGFEEEVAAADTAAVVGEGPGDSQGKGVLGFMGTTGRVEVVVSAHFALNFQLLLSELKYLYQIPQYFPCLLQPRSV